MNTRTFRRITSTIITIFLLFVSAVAYGQSNGDKLFMQGQNLQKKMTVASQRQAIKKFEAAKVVYTVASKKKMCDNQIAICHANIERLSNTITRGRRTETNTVEKRLSLSEHHVAFEGDKKGVRNIAVKAPTIDWGFRYSEGIAGEENFVKAKQGSNVRSLDIEVDANPTTIARRQTLYVYYDNLTDTVQITQAGKEVTLSTNSNLVEFKRKGGKKNIELYTNSDSIISSNNGLTWYVASKPEWVETSVEVKKEDSKAKKGLSIVTDLFERKAVAATATDAKVSSIIIIARPLPKSDPDYNTGRKGELVFASQDKTYTVTILQQ